MKEYYKNLNLDSKNFEFRQNLSGRFLKDGTSTLATPMTALCNLSIKLSKFPNKCKIAKLKALYKNGPNLETKNYRPIPLLPIISTN